MIEVTSIQYGDVNKPNLIACLFLCICESFEGFFSIMWFAKARPFNFNPTFG